MSETEMSAAEYQSQLGAKKGVGKFASVNASVKARAQECPGREMNATEERWARALAADQREGRVLWWAYEALRLTLANGCTYTPDFVWLGPDGLITVDEVKGPRGWKLDPKGRVKWKTAGEEWRFFRFRGIVLGSDKTKVEVYEPRGPWPPLGAGQVGSEART